MKKRVLSFVLVLMMVLSLMPAAALALGTITITKQPQSQTVYAGDDVTFTCAAEIKNGSSGSTPSYIWFDADEVNLDNLSFTKKVSTLVKKALGTGESLTLSSVTVDQDGTKICCAVYSVKDVAIVISNEATLTVEVHEACDVHTLTWHEGKDATCCSDGNLGYYYCDVCHRMYLDEDATMEVTLDDVTIPVDPTAHDMVHHERQEPTCKEDGNIEYWQCNYCGNRYDNAEGTGDKLKLSDIEIDNDDAEHKLVQVPAKESTCCEKGNKEYYVCEVCGDYFNASGTMEYSKSDVELPLLDHTPAYAHDSNTHWQYCTMCESILEDTTELHNDDLQEATCVHRAVCECGYEYGEVNPDNHVNTEIINFKEATTRSTGYTGDVYCNDCKQIVEYGHETDKLCDHKLTHVEAKEEGCDQCEDGGYGNIEYWYCDKCGCYYTDAEAQTEVSADDVKIEPHTHYITAGSVTIANFTIQEYAYDDTGHWKVCKYCGFDYDKSDYSVHTMLSSAEPTCCSGHSCLVCGYDDGERDPDNHVGGTEIQGAYEPEGKKAGYTGDEVCLGCGAILTQGYEYYAKCGDCAKHLKFVEGYDCTCTQDGMKDCWECTKCHNRYMDENATVDATTEELTIQCTGHDLHPSLDTLEVTNVVTLARELGMYEYLTDLVKSGEFSSIKDITVDQFLDRITIKDIDHCSDDECHWLGCERCGMSLADMREDLEAQGIFINEKWYELSAKQEHSGGTATCCDQAVCEVCGSSYGELGDHRYDKVVTEATCTEPGSVKYICNGCQDEMTELEETTPALGHNYVKGKCTRCGERMSNPFYDVSSSDIYYTAVMWAYTYDPQITSGTDEHHFSPKANCTRGQVVTFLWRAAGCPEVDGVDNPFVDVSSTGSCAPYYKAILWAYSEGITNGTDATHFSPNATVTRGQFVTFLWRYYDEPMPATGSNPFVDVSESSPFYTAILWAYGQGITTGYDDTHFKPGQTCNRWQVVMFMYRAIGEQKAY